VSGRQSEATARGLELIRGGATLRAAAGQVGVAVSTLVRACQRAGITLPRGRPSSSAAPGTTRPG